MRAELLTVLIRHFSRFLIVLIGPYSNKISMQEEIRTPCSCLVRASGLILISLLYLSPFPQHCQNHLFQFRYNINPFIHSFTEQSPCMFSRHIRKKTRLKVGSLVLLLNFMLEFHVSVSLSIFIGH